MKDITVIGATGRLAIPIVRSLVDKGFRVKAIVRNTEKAIVSLPSTVEILKADLEDVPDLTNALRKTEYIYLHLASKDIEADFVPEIHGIQNVVDAVDKKSIKQIIQISGVGAVRPDFHARGEIYFTNEIRRKGFSILKNCGIPFTLLHASWFLDAISWFEKDDRIIIQGKQIHPIYWTNTLDFANVLMKSIGNESAYNRDLIVQGNKALTMLEAARLFNDICRNGKLRVEQEDDTLGLFAYFDNFKEELIAQDTWSLVGPPALAPADFFKTLQ